MIARSDNRDEPRLPERRRFRLVVPSFPAFNIYSTVARTTTALGPLYVATVVNKMEGWDVEVIDENNYRRFGPTDPDGRPDHAALQSLRPADVVGFYGGLTSTAPHLYRLARFYRERNVVTIGGGQHFAGHNIEEGLDNGLDFIVVGEGEETIRELLPVAQSGGDASRIAGIAFRRDGRTVVTAPRPPVHEFEKLPVPDFSLVRYAKFSLYPVSWVRGCGMNCEFCTVKGKVRCPAPEYVVEQISSLLEKRNARRFFLVDDLFGQDRDAALRLCDLLRVYQQTVGVRFNITVQIRLDKARDRVLLGAMRAAGITTVAIGIESPIPEELEAMHKRLKPEEMIELSRTFHDAGFLVHGMFIFGYPLPAGAAVSVPAKERVRRFRRFIRQAKIDTVQVLLPVPLPGTEMTDRLARQNRIFPKEIVGWEYYDGNFPLFEPDPPLTPEQMQNSVRAIMARFYRFGHMFTIGLSVLAFPSLVFVLHNLRWGWRRWYRPWRNSIMRFGGWFIVRRWVKEFRKGVFSRKLAEARKTMDRRRRPTAAATPPTCAGCGTET